ncbi:MFS general substrate transporter [Schizopora paradoxa]|uniref:MFS general substrate transporter n=1 Tax=Schizopora paradoxa TaxID=27342 RepID=A0A0H2RLR9_9AGAM|nr:MFS general substrate transporter [Schizopora paradoxa]
MDPKLLSLAETASVNGASISPTVNDERQLNEPEVELVYFDENDPEDPKNWSETKKVTTIAMLCAMAFCGVFGSSSYAPGEPQVMRMFGVNAEAASVGLTVYVLGFAFGPLLCPMSELFGRRLPYLISWPLLVACIAPSAWVNNFAVILVFRFLTGVTSACTLTNGSGVISDMYSNEPRKLAKAIVYYSFCPLSGPIFGSLIGFFVAAHMTHGLWVIRIHFFFAVALLPLPFLLPETHAPTLLTQRAKRLRANGRTNAYAVHELHKYTLRELVKKHIGRPVAMLIREPILQGAAVWITLAYSIIYFFFEAFPVVFVEQNHIPFQLGGLPFTGITIGMLICVFTTDVATRLSKRVTIPFIDPPVVGTPVTAPEAGLKAILPAVLFMPISLFWFAWTSKGNVHWISPILAGIPFGYSMLCIFNSFITYSSHTYMIYASSALAANTLARSIIASVLPVVAHPLLNNLGTEWGVSIFAFLSLGLLPIPLIFVRYGSLLREKSHFAREAREVIAATRNQATDNDNTGDDSAPIDEKEEKRNINDLESGNGIEVTARPSIEKNASSE